MESKHIKIVFENYLRSNSKSALLINGVWGSGKTFFFSKDLIPVASNNGFKSYYISLNGIATIASLEQSLLVKLMINTERRELQGKIKAGTKFLNLFSQFVAKTSLENLLSDTVINLISFKSKIICVDDLERCDIPLNQVLGYLNNLVEHRDAKIIILSDETKISLSNTYSNIKEKLIGRILNFEQDLSVVFGSVIESYNSRIGYKNFLLRNQNYILSLFKAIGLTNLRTVSSYLDVVGNFYKGLDEIHDEIVLKEVLEFSLFICVEFREGRLNSSDYKNYKGLNVFSDIIFDLYKNDSEVDESKTYARSFCKRYFLAERYYFSFYPSIYEYILSGYLDENRFNVELMDRKKLNATIEQQEFNELITYNFRGLSNERFSELLFNVKQHAEAGVYSIYDYAHFADFYFYFFDQNLSSLTYEDIKRIVDNGLDIAKERKELDKYKHDNLMHFKKENPETEIIKEKILKIHNDIFMTGQESINQKVNSDLANGDEESLRKLFDEHRFSPALFNNINITDLTNTLFSIENKSLSVFCNLMHDRYCTTSNIKDYLAEEKEVLTLLETNIFDESKNEKLVGLKKFNFEQLKNILSSALNAFS